MENNRDQSLSLMPYLLREPGELLRQVQRGRIQGESTDSCVQRLVEQYQQRYPDAFGPIGQTMRPAQRLARNPVMRALRSVGSRIKSIIP